MRSWVRWSLVGACAISLAAACASEEQARERTGNERATLTPVVSAPFDLEPELEPIPYDGYGLYPFACNSERCAVFYGAGGPGGGTYYFTNQGSNTVRRFLEFGESPNVVGLPNDQFLATVLNPNAVALRVSGADGAVVEKIRLSWTDPLYGARLASTGTTVLALKGFQPATVTVLRASDLSPVGPAREVVGLDHEPSIVAGDGQYLIVWEGHALRVDAATGAVVDPQPIVLSKYSTGYTVGTFANGYYHLFWWGGEGLLGARLRASDGVLLDVDDDFNERTGAHLICSACYPSNFYLHTAHTLNEGVLVSWPSDTQTGGRLLGALVDPATGAPMVGTPAGGSTLGEFPDYAGHRYFDDERGFVVADNRLNEISLSHAPLSGTVVDRIPLVRYVDPRRAPSVAVRGDGYLVSWQYYDWQVQARRVGSGGELLDDQPLVLGQSGGTLYKRNEVVSATSGVGTLVAWSGYDRLRRRMVHADGSLGPELPAIEASDDDEVFSSIRLVFNGDFFYLTYENDDSTWGLKLAPDGTALGYPQFLFTFDDPHMTLADTAPASDRRTFLSWHQTGKVRRLRSQSGALLDTTNIDCPGVPQGATDGSRFFALCGTRGLLIDPVSGTEVAGSSRDLWPDVGGQFDETPAAWHDGRSFLALLGRHMNEGFYRLTLRRFDETLAGLDSEVGGFGHFVAESTMMDHRAAAAGENGRSLVAYEAFDKDKGGLVIKARFITNDGLPAPASEGDQDPSDGGAAGSDGAGGSGIDPGAGGEAGSSDAGGSGGAAQGGSGNGDAGTAGEGADAGGAPSTGGMDPGQAGGAGGAPSDGGTNQGQSGADTSPDAGESGAGTGGSRSGAGGVGTGGPTTGGTGGRGGKGGSAGAPSSGAAGAEAGDGGEPTAPEGGESDGCGCSVPAQGAGGRHALMLAFMLACAGVARRSGSRRWKQRLQA
jgi:hypothetical protein